MQETTAILGMGRESLQNYFAAIGEKPFRAQQTMQWLHQRGVTDIAQMTDLSKSLRARLSATANITVPRILQDNIATDGTRKWLLAVPGKSAIEMVFIPEQKRGTLCVSSQVGCTLNCSFCATGKQGYNRDLTAAEIIAQIALAKRLLEKQYQTEDRIITNVVFMGMGEPLLNLDSVLDAVNIMQDDFAYGLSKRRITISTAGVVPKIDALKQNSAVSLAVSLHAPNNELRNELVPLNKKYPIEQLLDACWRYVSDTNRGRVTFEYIMLQGVNDEPEHAQQLIGLLRDKPAKVNLIPFNAFDGIDYQRSSNNRIHRFFDQLASHNINVTVRKTRGDDIEAACGQLAGDVMDRTKRSAKFLKTRQTSS